MTDAKTVFDAVRKIGLTKAQARAILPTWWSAEMEKGQSGATELALHLARRLSLDIESLAEGAPVPRGAAAKIAFKHHGGLADNELSAASFLASSVARTILSACTSEFKRLPNSPQKLQNEMRRIAAGIPIGFESLLTTCWQHGIPVIPLPKLPPGIRKMDGAALRIGDRPAIVIAKKKSSRAWLSFILAHEVGHICLGHLSANSSIIDVSLQDAATYSAESSADSLEASADEFALSVLGGAAAENAVANWSSQMAPVELAVAAREAAGAPGLEPGHLVLRYAFLRRRWPEAAMALRFLTEDFDAEKALVRAMKAHIESDRVAEDLQEWIDQVTGMSVSE